MGKITLAKAEAALIAHHGILSKAAEACGVTRKAFYAFMDKHPHLEDLRAEAGEILLDVAEANVVADLNKGDGKTTRWFLERKGKDRGYTTRQEVTGADGGPLEGINTIRREIVDPTDDGD